MWILGRIAGVAPSGEFFAPEALSLARHGIAPHVPFRTAWQPASFVETPPRVCSVTGWREHRGVTGDVRAASFEFSPLDRTPAGPPGSLDGPLRNRVRGGL